MGNFKPKHLGLELFRRTSWLLSLSLIVMPAALNAQQPDSFTPADAASLRAEISKTLPKTVKILAVCGPSEGYEYYPNEVIGGMEPRVWGKGGISKGRFVFVVDGEDFDVIFADATADGKDIASVRGEEGVVLSSYVSEEMTSRIFVAVYPGYPNVETYALLTKSDGERELLWTATRPLIGERSPLAKVAAFRSRCY